MFPFKTATGVNRRNRVFKKLLKDLETKIAPTYGIPFYELDIIKQYPLDFEL